MTKHWTLSAILFMAARCAESDSQWTEENIFASETAVTLVKSKKLNDKVLGEFHSHGLLHNHRDWEIPHYHDFTKIKPEAAFKDRKVHYGHSHEHTHKGRFGAHIHDSEILKTV